VNIYIIPKPGCLKDYYCSGYACIHKMQSHKLQAEAIITIIQEIHDLVRTLTFTQALQWDLAFIESSLDMGIPSKHMRWFIKHITYTPLTYCSHVQAVSLVPHCGCYEIDDWVVLLIFTLSSLHVCMTRLSEHCAQNLYAS
jgi:hypothetical protein